MLGAAKQSAYLSSYCGMNKLDSIVGAIKQLTYFSYN